MRLHQRGFVEAVSGLEPAAFDHYSRKGLSTIGKKSQKLEFYAFALRMENGFCRAAQQLSLTANQMMIQDAEGSGVAG